MRDSSVGRWMWRAGAMGLLLLVSAALGAGPTPASQPAVLPAFPGAEGFGSFATGGRGGDVYIVTNLNASGPGSFAEGIATVPAKGRTIVFAVSGYIPINKLHLKSGKLTIAGQTAPGAGVGLRDSSFFISGEDVVIRFMRFRHGRDGNGGDCVDPDGNCKQIIFDHCDMLFSTDENFSMFRSAPQNMTYQWSINAWGLQTHSAGGLWLIDHATAHHTLWANNHTRNPKLIRPKVFDWVNNVTFGWDIGFNLAGADEAGDYKTNIRGSWFIHGGRTGSAIFGGGKAPDGSVPFRVYVDDCALDGTNNKSLDASATDFDIINAHEFNRQAKPFAQNLSGDDSTKGDQAIGVNVQVEPRDLAYKKILSQVGVVNLQFDPDLPLRDEVSSLLIDDVTRQTRRMIKSEAELGLSNGGFGLLKSAPAPVDSDKDGIPDEFERALGWKVDVDDHNDPLAWENGIIASPSFLPSGSPAGYTHLEEYLHFLAVPHGIIRKSSPTTQAKTTIDLRKFACGFTDSPVFTIDSVKSGTVVQSGPGGCIVEFTTTGNHAARAGFNFTVKDRFAHQWTQQCDILLVIAE